MNSAVINIKTQPQTKKEAQKVAESLGLSLSAVINGFLKHLVKTKEIHFNTSEQPTEYMIQALKESKADIKAGRVSPSFNTTENALAWLDDPARKYENQVRKKSLVNNMTSHLPKLNKLLKSV